MNGNKIKNLIFKISWFIFIIPSWMILIIFSLIISFSLIDLSIKIEFYIFIFYPVINILICLGFLTYLVKDTFKRFKKGGIKK